MSAPVAASVLLAAAMLYEHRESLLVSSYEVRPEQWQTTTVTTACGLGVPVASALDEERAGAEALIWRWSEERGCGAYESTACRSDRLRAQLEALEANRSYDEVLATSPTGVAFVAPTRVRGYR
jgi:hypothetical protein